MHHTEDELKSDSQADTEKSEYVGGMQKMGERNSQIVSQDIANPQKCVFNVEFRWNPTYQKGVK